MKYTFLGDNVLEHHDPANMRMILVPSDWKKHGQRTHVDTALVVLHEEAPPVKSVKHATSTGPSNHIKLVV